MCPSRPPPPPHSLLPPPLPPSLSPRLLGAPSRFFQVSPALLPPSPSPASFLLCLRGGESWFSRCGVCWPVHFCCSCGLTLAPPGPLTEHTLFHRQPVAIRVSSWDLGAEPQTHPPNKAHLSCCRTTSTAAPGLPSPPNIPPPLPTPCPTAFVPVLLNQRCHGLSHLSANPGA